jgi:hypothetical protein
MSALISPLHQRSAPGKATAKGCQYQVIAFLQLLFPFPQAEGDGGSRGITKVLDVQHYFFVGEAHAVGRSIDDPFVGLVRHQPGNIITGELDCVPAVRRLHRPCLLRQT